ncbi:MAG: lipopolysaccharide assembly protein LapA domain-containing protein [Marinicella pacifica]
MKTIKKTLIIVLVIILLSFIVTLSALNLEAGELNMYFFTVNASLGFIVLMTLIAGVLIGALISWVLWLWPANREKRHWQRRYHQLRQETESQPASSQALKPPTETR